MKQSYFSGKLNEDSSLEREDQSAVLRMKSNRSMKS